jgi:hypothetical protein
MSLELVLNDDLGAIGIRGLAQVPAVASRK